MIFHTKIYKIMEKSFLYFKKVDGNETSYFEFNIWELTTWMCTKDNDTGRYSFLFSYGIREDDFEKMEKITEAQYNEFMINEVKVDLPF